MNFYFQFNFLWIFIASFIQMIVISLPKVTGFALHSNIFKSSIVTFSSHYTHYATKRGSNNDFDITTSDLDENKPNGQTINWYPGHIAKAER